MILSTCKKVFRSHWLLSCGVILFFIATIAFTLLPPLLFAKIIDLLSTKQNIAFLLIFPTLYFFYWKVSVHLFVTACSSFFLKSLHMH